MAAVPISLAGSSGFSEAQTCDNGTETQTVTLEHTEVLQLGLFSHIPILDSEQLSLPMCYEIEVWQNHPKKMRFLPRRGLGTEVRSFPSSALEIMTSLEKGPAGGQDPQTVRGTSAPAKPKDARDQAGKAREEAKMSPRPVGEDAAAWARQ